MKRTLLILLAGAAVMLPASTSRANPRVVRKPAPRVLGPDEFVVYDHWVSSWGLRDDYDGESPKYPMGIKTHRTLEAAVAAANAHMARTSGNGEWAVTHYLIEGEPSIRSRKGPSLPTDKRVADDTLSSLEDDTRETLRKFLEEDVENAFKKKKRELEDVFNRVKDFKEYATRNVDKIVEDDFDRINALVSRYNSKANDYAKEQPGGEYFSRLPRLTPMIGDRLRNAGDSWNGALTSQVDLEAERQWLVEEQKWLDEERAALAEEGISLESEANDLARELAELEDRLSGMPLLAGTAWSPMTDEGWWRYEFVGGERSGTVTRSPGEGNIDSARARGRWTLKDTNTVVIELAASGRPGYSSYSPGRTVAVKVVSRNRLLIENASYGGDQLEFKPPPDAESIREAMIRAREKNSAVRAEQGMRQQRVRQYRDRLAAYQTRLQGFERDNSKHRSAVRQLQDSGYVPPLPNSNAIR